MSTSALARTLSLDASARANAAQYIALLSTPIFAPSSFNVWFGNNILMTRWCLRYFSYLISIVPPPETRLHDESMVSIQNYARSLLDTLKNVAQTRGITVPQFPDVLADWEEEAGIDYKTLHEALLPHSAEATKEIIEYTTGLMNEGGKYHWASLVAAVSVAGDMYLDVMITTKGLVGTIGDKTLAPYKNAVTGSELLDGMRMMGEEVMRIRSEAEETGWREEEAKELSAGLLKRMKDFFAIVPR